MRFLAVLLGGWIGVISLQGASYEVIENTSSLKILTPSLQEMKTVKIRLSNHLEALVISSPTAHESCAALAVTTGSWDDPTNEPGMAHFVEHLLFMGTKAYPKESEYQQFISDHGGTLNAYTTCTRTVYGFSIHHDAFLGGLSRFSHFFIDPLFLESSIKRELLAVDQEHAKNIENDAWRSYMILKETSHPLHPNTKFSTGNKATLSSIPRAMIEQWYKQHYSAHQMHLVVVAPLPIDELIEAVVTEFSPIINRANPQESYPSPLLSDQQKGHFLYIEPIKDRKELSLIWELPKEIVLNQTSHAADLFIQALSHPGENGLYHLLKEQGLIWELSSSVDRLSQECALLSIDFALTDQGVTHVKDVIQQTFEVITSLQTSGIPRLIFEEYCQKARLEYLYQSQEHAFSFAMKTAAELTYEPLASYPELTLLPQTYEQQTLQQLLNTLTPQECLYMVIAPSQLTHVTPSCQETWMKGAYHVEPLSSDELSSLLSLSASKHFQLPSPNPYFPETLSLLASSECKEPALIMNSDLGKVYTLQDTSYLLPQAAVVFHIRTPFLNGSSLSDVITAMYQESVLETFKQTEYLASQAGLQLDLSHDSFKWRVHVSGYNDKLLNFFEQFLIPFASVRPTQSQFVSLKEKMLTSYRNRLKELPLRQALQALPTFLLSPSASLEAQIQLLERLSYQEFIHHISTQFQSNYVEGFIYGNLSLEESVKFTTAYQTAISHDPFAPQLHPRAIPQIPKTPLMVLKPTSLQGYGAVLAVDQGPFSFSMKAIQTVLSAALKDDFFNTLRTKQQTGYIVTSFDREFSHHLFQLFAVQSTTHTPQELLFRFELFIEEFIQELSQKVSEARFKTLKNMAIDQLHIPPLTVDQKALQLQTFAFKYQGDFDWISKCIAAVEELTYDDFLQTASKMLSRKNRGRLAILVEGQSPQDRAFSYQMLPESSDKNAYFTPDPSTSNQ
ncbi:MAG: insulinase family protein [Candidatus Rhabdochlamydia sp.]